MRLTHVSGYWSCIDSRAESAKTNWGCRIRSDAAAVLITDASGPTGSRAGSIVAPATLDVRYTGQNWFHLEPTSVVSSTAPYEQYGCSSGPRGYDYRPPDVGTAADGISIFDRCSEACASQGYNFFGLECPMENRTHCQCYGDGKVLGKAPVAQDCSVGARLAQCSNTPTLNSGGTAYSLGGWDTGSIYRVKSTTTTPSTLSPSIVIPIAEEFRGKMCGTFYLWYSEVWTGWTVHDNHGTITVEIELVPPPPPPPPVPPPPPTPAPPIVLTYCSSWGDPHLTSFSGERYDHMGLGAFQLLDAPTAQLEVQTFQCPQPAWRSGATANVALAARVGNHTVVIVGDQLLVFDEPNTGAPPSLVVESEDAAEHDYEVQSTAGEFHIRSSAVRNGKRRWRLESRDFVISSHSKPAPAGLVAMGHMMDYQIGLGPQHVVLSGNSGLCTKRCSGVTLAGSSECVHADCNVVADEQTLFNQVNASLFTLLLERCSGLNNPEPRSPCDTPTSSEACRTTGFPLASATAACAPLQGSTVPDIYESCIYDCCVTGDVDFCRGLAEDSEAQIKEFEEELVTDGRFVNIDANSAFYQLNRTLPSPRDDLWVCSVAFGGRDDTVETVVLPNGIGLPGTLQEVSANSRNVLLLLDAEALNTSLELESAFEAAHLSSGQLYPCTEFHFAPVRIGFEGVATLAASLRRGAMPRLEHLTLSTNLIGSNATIALVDAIRAGGPRGPILRNLKVLNLRSNLIGEDGVNGLATALKDGVLASLQFVDLADNPVNSSVKALLTRARSGLVVR